MKVQGARDRWCVLLGTVWLVPAAAHAGNGGHPRTPVVWPDDVACLTVVDRSQSTLLHMGYQVPYPDIDLTPDELPDSRRHQFIAFCDGRSAGLTRPNWLSWADADTWLAWAMAHELDAMPVADDDVVETSPLYKDRNCFFRITGDDARRPITHEAASEGVEWDTAVVPAGAYVVEGYTWEPELNHWSQRPGVVHVVDGPELAAVGPAAAVTGERGEFVAAGGTHLVEGCARAMPGSTLRGAWSLPDSRGWQVFAADVPLAGDAFALPFTPPPQAYGELVALRVEVIDPLGRSFAAYPEALLTVLAASSSTTGCAGTCGDTGTATESDGDSEAPTSGVAGANSSTTSGDAAPAGALAPGACGCRSGSGPGWGLMVLVALVGRRRRMVVAGSNERSPSHQR